MIVELPTHAATERFGRALGAALFPGAVVALHGDLGAGKTTLTRAVAAGLGVANPAVVTSPTFGLVHEYAGRVPVFHFDAYRLSGPREFWELGAEEYLTAGGVCLIEWASRVAAALPADRLDLTLTATSEHARSATLVAGGRVHAAWLTRATDSLLNPG